MSKMACFGSEKGKHGEAVDELKRRQTSKPECQDGVLLSSNCTLFYDIFIQDQFNVKLPEKPVRKLSLGNTHEWQNAGSHVVSSIVFLHTLK